MAERLREQMEKEKALHGPAESGPGKAEGTEDFIMNKMSELSRALDEMVACGEGLIRTANAIREMFTEEP